MVGRLKLLGQFCRSLTPTQHTAQVKFINNQRHTGLKQYRVAKVKGPKLRLCPCCPQEEEDDDDHVYFCIDNPGREKALRLFRNAKDSASTQPTVKVLMNMVNGWVNGWLEGQETIIDFREFH